MANSLLCSYTRTYVGCSDGTGDAGGGGSGLKLGPNLHALAWRDMLDLEHALEVP